MADNAAVEYRTVVFELTTDGVPTVNPGGVDLESFLNHLSRDEGWRVVSMTGGLGGTVGAQRKGVVLLERPRPS